MYLTEELQKRWKPILEHKDLPAIKDPWRRSVTAMLLENEQKFLAENASGGFLTEAAPANASGAFPNAANLKGYDPILIALIRRAMPQLIAFDICGVQPMTGPTGLIFALKSKYTSQGGTEALFDEANSAFSGTGAQAGTAPMPQATTNTYKAGTGLTTAAGEALGDGVGAGFAEMSFSIDKVTVTAKTRKLKAEYTLEIQQDLKAVQGLDAESELMNILSTEILAEINREVVRQIGHDAMIGAQHNTATPGTYDLDTDSNGRWSVERFKGLHFQLDREANAIAIATRRGKGNLVICSADVASALSMTGLLDVGSNLAKDNLNVDPANNTFVGVLNGKYKVYVDPYVAPSATNYAIVGYRGASPYDAGIFYCPYVPLQMVRAVGEQSFQPKLGFLTRYGIVSNPFANAAGDGSLVWGDPSDATTGNKYYRKFQISSIM